MLNMLSSNLQSDQIRCVFELRSSLMHEWLSCGRQWIIQNQHALALMAHCSLVTLSLYISMCIIRMCIGKGTSLFYVATVECDTCIQWKQAKFIKTATFLFSLSEDFQFASLRSGGAASRASFFCWPISTKCRKVFDSRSWNLRDLRFFRFLHDFLGCEQCPCLEWRLDPLDPLTLRHWWSFGRSSRISMYATKAEGNTREMDSLRCDQVVSCAAMFENV